MKQDVYANRGLNFNTLTPREFEEVVYNYFKDQISKGFYEGIYDNVKLSSGVAEQGADAMLFFKGTIKGIVQCKRLKNNIGIDLILNEIIKLLCHHILETQLSDGTSSKLINDIEDFTYYFVTSKGFTQNATTFLADFNKQWKEARVKPIFNKLIKQKAFVDLDPKQAFEELKNLLNTISVATLSDFDLDPIVRMNDAVINRYFLRVEPMPNTKPQEVKKPEQPPQSFNLTEVKRKIDTISNDITRVKAHFGNIKDSVVERREVQDIFNWIKKRPTENESNIAVVAGNAGIGKSVIISTLYGKLKEANIPVVSFKADRMLFGSFKELKEEYSLEVDFEDLFNKFIATNERGVLLIDQIDALSQALSSDLKPLRFYDNLIQRFKVNPNVKIVISTRIYDLNYDPIIANYKGKKTFKIGALDIADVKDVLAKHSVKPKRALTSSFLELLTVPLHLEVFLSVYKDELDVNEIKSLQDLYSELWRQKVLKSSNSSATSNTSNFIFAVAEKMYEKQDINIDSILFEDKFFKEINYLKSVGILALTNKIEFFHQSFFDYAYSRNFLQTEKDLTQNLLGKHQGLYVRSKVKQVLNYKKNVEVESYIKDIETLLVHQDIRFHIKLLVMQQLAFQENPSSKEQDIVELIVFGNKDLRSAFASLTMGSGWQYFFIDRNIFTKAINEDNKDYKRQILQCFRPLAIQNNQAHLLQYYNKLKDTSIKDELILDYFWQIGEVKEPLAIGMVKDVFKRKNDFRKQYWFYRVLEHSAEHFPNWVEEALFEDIDIKEGVDIADDRNYFHQSHQGSQVYEKLWEKHPDIAYDLVKRIIKEIINKRKFDRDGNIIVDSAYLLYDRKNINLYKHYEQLDRLQQYLEESYPKNSEFIRNEVQDFLESNYITELVIAFTVIYKYPGAFIDEAFNFFTKKRRLDEVYGLNQYLKYMILEVFGEMYHKLSADQQKIIDEQVISKFQKKSELSVEYKKAFNSNWYGIGKYELLSAIKSKGNLAEHWKKHYQELFRNLGRLKTQNLKE